MNVEHLILSNLIYNEQFVRETIPYLRCEYFDSAEATIFGLISNYFEKYKTQPNRNALLLDLENNNELNENQVNVVKKLIKSLTKEDVDYNHLRDNAERFCRDKALYIALRKAIQISDGKDKNISRGEIPKILSEALSVSFDSHIGHDFLDNSEKRYDFYHCIEEKIQFDIDLLNQITNGGISKKTLSLFIAPTGVGKTMVMCSLAADFLKNNKNVLYITMEMAEEKIAERIDSNLLNIPLLDISKVEKSIYENKMDKLKQTTKGKLIIKEYPTACAGVNHFRFLLSELRLKKKFVPDIIFIDYLNICAAARFKNTSSTNSYEYVKVIAEEMRGLAVEFNVPIFSATQTNRKGVNNSDFELTETSDSMGSTFTADLILALISTKELRELNQIMIKQLKNRFNSLDNPSKFVVGLDMAYMRLYNIETQDGISSEDVPVFDKSSFMEQKNREDTNKKKKSIGNWII